MVVRSTPTAADAMLERKKILDGNAIHIQERDIIVRDLKTAQETLNGVRAETKAEESLRDDLRRTNEIETRDFENARGVRKEAIRVLEAKETALSGQITIKESREAALDTAIQAKTDHHATLEAETTKYQDLANSAKEEHAATMATMQQQLSDLAGKIAEAQKSLESTKKEEEGLLINRRAEDKRLATARNDLEIWKGRVMRGAQAIGMDPAKIIV